MSGHDLFMEMQDKQQLLEKALKELGRRGRAKADSEQKYRVALAQEILIKRDKGFPATLISDLCRGEKHIADGIVSCVNYSNVVQWIKY